MFSIPKSEDLKSKWFGVIGREVNKHSAVCCKHFEKQDFVYKVVAGNVKRFVLPLAVPVIHGYSDRYFNTINSTYYIYI